MSASGCPGSFTGRRVYTRAQAIWSLYLGAGCLGAGWSSRRGHRRTTLCSSRRIPAVMTLAAIFTDRSPTGCVLSPGLLVSPSERGKGFGSSLLEAADEAGWARGSRTNHIDVPLT